MPTSILNHLSLTWTNITHPEPGDIQALATRYPQFHPLNLQDCLTELEYPKLDHHDHYLFLVVQIPYIDQKLQLVRAAEVDIFIAHNNLITSHRGELRGLNEMFSRAQDNEGCRQDWMGSGASPLLYHILNTLFDEVFPMIHGVSAQLRHVEQILFNKNTQPLLHEVSVLRRDIIVLRSILKSQLDVILGLIRGNWPFIEDHLDPYWGDIGDHLQQQCAALDTNAEVVGVLAETLDTLASHRIDEVVRLLTLTTILTLPVTLLATIFGMNVVMPYNSHPLLFFGLILAAILITGGMVLFLRKRHWL